MFNCNYSTYMDFITFLQRFKISIINANVVFLYYNKQYIIFFLIGKCLSMQCLIWGFLKKMGLWVCYRKTCLSIEKVEYMYKNINTQSWFYRSMCIHIIIIINLYNSLFHKIRQILFEKFDVSMYTILLTSS